MDTRTWWSTNGRWGAQLLFPVELAHQVDRGLVRAMINPLGVSSGMHCFELVPVTDDSFAVIRDDATAHAGCTRVSYVGLQSHRYWTLLAARSGAIWEEFGYRRRFSKFRILSAEGEVCKPPPAVLLATGLVKPDEEPPDVPVAPPLDVRTASVLREAGLLHDPLPSPLAFALKKSGIVS